MINSLWLDTCEYKNWADAEKNYDMEQLSKYVTVVDTNSYAEEQKDVEWLLLLI